MDIRVIRGDITQQQTGMIIVNLFQGVTNPDGATGAVDRALDGAISKLIEEREIKGKSGELTLIHTLGRMVPSRVLIVGLGPEGSFSVDVIRSVSAGALRRAKQIGVSEVATITHGAGIGGLNTRECAQAMAEGSFLGLYTFDKYKSDDADRNNVARLTVVESDESQIEALEAGIERGGIIADAVNMCRDMGNEPANFMTPTRMAEIGLEAAREAGLEIEVLDLPQMSELGMGALVGVAQGSEEPPKFIILRHNGDPSDSSNNLGLLGKGITFDSGGLDIKNASGMLTMKGDMAGGASVIAAMKAIGRLNPKINVTGIVPATENMPGGKAQRPGDVVRAMNGKTIEIGNTDAEGRLVLADAVAYANSIGLSRLVDVATLTGAVRVALGDQAIGAFGNDQAWTDQVIAAGNEVGERMWQLPTFDEYKDSYKSDIADINNTGGQGAGAIIGALIIGEFADDTPWVHLDIAGVHRSNSVRGYNPKGETGTPVRALINLAVTLAK